MNSREGGQHQGSFQAEERDKPGLPIRGTVPVSCGRGVWGEAGLRGPVRAGRTDGSPRASHAHQGCQVHVRTAQRCEESF